jgi:hypothetical protein
VAVKPPRLGFVIAALVALAVASPFGQASLSKAGGSLFGAAATSTTRYSNSSVADIVWDPTMAAGRSVTATTGRAAAGLFYSDWAPTGTRTAQSWGLAHNMRVLSGAFSGSIRGFFNELDVVTTTAISAVGVTGIRNDVIAHSGATPLTHNLMTASLNQVITQGAAGVTNAEGVWSIIENDGTGVIGTAKVYYGGVGNYGAGITTGYTYYADESNATNQWSFYGVAGAGKAEINDGVKAPIISYSASSVLNIASNVIAPTNGIHHLGAGLVKTITVPSKCYTACSVMIIPDAAFTTDATGNISLASTAVINRALIFVWDGTKWNPSY